MIAKIGNQDAFSTIFIKTTEEHVKGLFIGGIVPEVGQELKIICTNKVQTGHEITISLNLEVVTK